MSQDEATTILRTKYPTGRIYYKDMGRFSHSNNTVIVNFTDTGKDYRYNGSYSSVLCHLGLLTIETIVYSVSDPSKNPFLLALNKNQ